MVIPLLVQAMSESRTAAFTRVGNDWRHWMRTAKTLFGASKILRCERERGPASIEIFTIWTELMLTAFGIECLIKAIWLRQGHPLAQNGKYVPMPNEEPHNLVKLCHAARIALDSRETDALERISYIARSIGRYPIAKKAGQIEVGLSWNSVDDGIIQNLIVKLQKKLRQNAT